MLPQLPSSVPVRGLHGPGTRGARTRVADGVPEPDIGTHKGRSAACGSGWRTEVCKTVGSAYVGSNPTPATTCANGPLTANSRVGGPFLLRSEEHTSELQS